MNREGASQGRACHSTRRPRGAPHTGNRGPDSLLDRHALRIASRHPRTLVLSVTHARQATSSHGASAPVSKRSTGAAAILVPLQKDGGTYVVPVLINGVFTLPFVVDSGAADVSIPADVVLTLFRTGTLERTDFIGEKTYRLADGSTVPSATFRMRFLTVGNVKIRDVTANVAPVAGPLLLGQSFLARFRSWSIDNARQVLVLEPLEPYSQQKPPPQAHVTVAQHLHLRLQPDPGAPEVLDYRMPQGSQVTIIDDCQVWTGSGRGAQDADNVWCPVVYGSYRGWANAYYLALGDGRRFACVLYPSAQMCGESTVRSSRPCCTRSP